jgi:hypothetical protein
LLLSFSPSPCSFCSGYDFSSTVDQSQGFAHCQKYKWTLVDYSEQWQPFIPPSPSSPTRFIDTPGFAVLMSFVGLVVLFGGIFGVRYLKNRRAAANANGNTDSSSSSSNRQTDPSASPYIGKNELASIGDNSTRGATSTDSYNALPA